MRYAGSTRVRPDRLRSRVATRRARLRRLLTMIDAQGRLVARGTVSRGVPGVVRLRFDAADESSVLHYHAPIVRGAWRLRGPLPSKAAAAGGQLSIQYTGAEGRRIRGESLSKAVAR